MKVFVATTLTQGTMPGDFAHVPDGEVVVSGAYSMCDSHSVSAGGPSRCGCDRSFNGIASGTSTTSALIAEMDTTREQLIDQFTTRLTDGWGAETAKEIAVSEVDFMLETAEGVTAGTVIGQDAEAIFIREGATL